MQIKYKYLIIILLGTTILSCSVRPQFSEIPELTYTGLSQSSMVQSSVLGDSLFLFFRFTDGDGDIGVAQNQNKFDLTITDNRTGNIYDRYKTPFVPEQGASNGIEGTVQLKLFTTCCIFEGAIPPCSAPPEFPTDTLTLDIQMTDRAGNISNVITTDMIVLFCD